MKNITTRCRAVFDFQIIGINGRVETLRTPNQLASLLWRKLQLFGSLPIGSTYRFLSNAAIIHASKNRYVACRIVALFRAVVSKKSR
jgi:hypothetical protein